MEPLADPERRRLVWRCRRGMKELDLLLTGYLGECFESASQAERAAFERILELPDPVLAAYLLQRDVPADPEVQALVAALRARTGARHEAVAAAAAASVKSQY